MVSVSTSGWYELDWTLLWPIGLKEHPSMAKKGNVTRHQQDGTTPSLCFSLTRLQEDVVSHYLSGKPIIRDISSLRTVFKFKQDKKSVDTKGLDSE